MRYVSLFVLLFVTSNVMAQIIEDKEPAILEVHYMKTWVADTLENRSYTDPMTLRVGKTSAMFYPTKMMWADSLLQTNFELHEKLHREMNPPGQIEYKPLGGFEREYLFRNINDGETMVYRKMGGEAYSYTEPTEMPAWQILSETKEVMGYSCQLATCDYRGRTWYAWFSTDIPINEGPWKLFGQAYLQKMYKEYILGDFAFKMSTLHGNGSQKAPYVSQYDYQERDYPHK